jgi:hypothetical protein
MAKMSQKEIREHAIEIVTSNPGGIHYSVLVNKLRELSSETPVNTIHGSIWDLHKQFPTKIAKPSRGLFSVPSSTVDVEKPPETTNNIKESDFYEPFAEYLKNDLNEVVVAVSLGGASMSKKWGTPDVVGIYKPDKWDVIQFSPEIVSAEIKLDPLQPVVAFGQAIAYRLFSSKTYIAMPNTMKEEDLERLEALCMLFGVGLVLFALNPNEPAFSIRVRAQGFFSDMFYANEFANRLKENDLPIFRKLFG